jgi:hypothetical protein
MTVLGEKGIHAKRNVVLYAWHICRFGKKSQGKHGKPGECEGIQVRVETNNESGAAFLE